MALECKSYLTVLGIICLCFFGIPIRIDKHDTTDNLLLFKSYVHNLNKSYESNLTEYEDRFVKFQKSLQEIKTLNKERVFNQSARYGLTKFSDMSQDEFINHHLQPRLQYHMKYRKASRTHSSKHTHPNSIRKRAIDDSLPLQFDWREKNVIADVRNQKTCDACWAFSTVENIESMNAIKTGTLQTLSVQQIIDCAGNGNNGCNGGHPCSLLKWLTVNKIHIKPEKEYPLIWQTETCRLKGSELGVQVADDYICESFVGRENAILRQIVEHGPVVAVVNAMKWQNYLSGVIQFHCDSSADMLNHVVQIVGYDRRPPIPHYIVRNSWGTDFGDNGYLYIAIGDSVCGVAEQVVFLDVL